MKAYSLPVAILSLLFVLSLVPQLLHAQSDTELEATIRAAIMSDPRSSEMSDAEIDALVLALSQGAEEQGVTSQDITWRPAPAESFNQGNYAVSDECGFICKANEAFGFTGPFPLIAISLGIVAAILLFVIGMLLHHRGHHALGKYPPTPAS
jgi:hypothetical protein